MLLSLCYFLIVSLFSRLSHLLLDFVDTVDTVRQRQQGLTTHFAQGLLYAVSEAVGAAVYVLWEWIRPTVLIQGIYQQRQKHLKSIKNRLTLIKFL